MKTKKFLAMLLALAMVISTASVGALAADEDIATAVPTYSDTADNWAKDAIERWSVVGIVKGDGNGNFNPNQAMSRGELAQMLVNMFGLTVKAENTFTDLKGDEWYADAILKCAAAGIMKGDGSRCNAETKISRQETMVMFGRAVGVTPDPKADMSEFTDGASVADWAAGYMAALAKMGIVTGGGDGNVTPTADIDRASTMALLSKAVSDYVNAPGEYKVDNAKGFVVVNVAAKEGEVVLSGKTAGVVVSAGTAEGKIVAKDLTADTIKVDGAAPVSVEGKSTVGEVTANATGAITVAKGVTVDTVTANAAGTITNNGTIKELTANAATKVDNKGTITKAEVKADGVVLGGKKPTEVKVDEGTKNPTDENGKDISATPDKPNTGTPGTPSTPDPDVVTLRPSGPATSGATNFDYAGAYAKAGVTLSGNTSYSTITINVNEEKMLAYVNDANNEAIVNDLVKVLDSGKYIFVGLSYPMSGAKYIQVGNGAKFALTPDGESVVGGNYVTYYAVAKHDTDKWVVSKDTTFAPKTIKWFNDETTNATTTKEVTVKRAVSGVAVDTAEELTAALVNGASTIQINGTIGTNAETDVFTVTRPVTIKDGTVNGSFVVKADADGTVFDGVTINNKGDNAGGVHRNGINAYCATLTVKNCKFNSGSAFANGLMILPSKTTVNYTITGNTFTGFKNGVEGWSTTAILITNKYPVSAKPFFGIMDETVAAIAEMDNADDVAIITGNTFVDCKNDYTRNTFGEKTTIQCTANSSTDNFRLSSGVAGSKFYVTGNVTRNSLTTIPAGAELIVAADKTLTIKEGVVLTNKGTLTVKGTLAVANYDDVAGLLKSDLKFEAGSTLTVGGVQLIGANTLNVDEGVITVTACVDLLDRAGTNFTIPSGTEATIKGICMDTDSYRVAKSDCITVDDGGTLNIGFNTEITGVLNVAGTLAIAEDVQVNVLAMDSKNGVLNVTGTLELNGEINNNGDTTIVEFGTEGRCDIWTTVGGALGSNLTLGSTKVVGGDTAIFELVAGTEIHAFVTAGVINYDVRQTNVAENGDTTSDKVVTLKNNLTMTEGALFVKNGLTLNMAAGTTATLKGLCIRENANITGIATATGVDGLADNTLSGWVDVDADIVLIATVA